MEFMELLLHHAVEAAILCFNFVGFIIILLAGARGIWDYIKKNPHTRLNLGNSMAMGLQFLMGGEILHTVVSNNLSDIAVVAALFAVRTGLAFVIHWELKEEKEEEEEREHKVAELKHSSEHVAEKA